jgi:hypothetical protein
MALKRIITKAEHAKLSDALKSEYKADADGENFTLDVEGYEDPAALKRAKDHEKKARQDAEKLAADLKTQLEAAIEERDGILKGAIPKGDVDKLEGSYKQKLAAREKELSDQIGALNGQLTTMLVDNVATGLASKISTSPEVILPHIRARLKAEQVDGKFVTRIIDGEGKPTALTIQDLEKEFVANKAFAPIITGSKASGGGAGGGGSGGGAPGKIDYTKSPKEIAAALKASGKIPAATE